MNRSKILDKAIHDCIWEMYRRAQPPLTQKEAKTITSADPTRKIYEEHYLSQYEQKIIAQKYVDAYNLDCKWKDYVDVIIRDFAEGHSKDHYVKGNGEKPGYRDYEKVPKLADLIGEEHTKVVLDILEDRKLFYRFDRRDIDTFMFNVFNFAPSSSKKQVEKKLGITIKDRTEEEIDEHHLDWRNYLKD